MSTISFTSIANNTLADATVVKGNFDAINTWLTAASIDNTNIAVGTILASNMASGSITGVKLNSNVVDNSTLQLSGNVLSVKALGIGSGQIAAGAVGATQIAALSITPGLIAAYTGSGAFTGISQDKMAPWYYQVSDPLTTQTVTSTSGVDLTSVTVTITSHGRPFRISILPHGTGSNSGFFKLAGDATHNAVYADVYIIRTVAGIPVTIAKWRMGIDTGNDSTSAANKIPTLTTPCSAFTAIDLNLVISGVDATYKVSALVDAGTTTLTATNVRLLVEGL